MPSKLMISINIVVWLLACSNSPERVLNKCAFKIDRPNYESCQIPSFKFFKDGILINTVNDIPPKGTLELQLRSCLKEDDREKGTHCFMFLDAYKKQVSKQQQKVQICIAAKSPSKIIGHWVSKQLLKRI